MLGFAYFLTLLLFCIRRLEFVSSCNGQCSKVLCLLGLVLRIIAPSWGKASGDACFYLEYGM